MTKQVSRYGTTDVSGIGMKPEAGFHTREYNGLRVTSLTKAQHDNTCGYWFLVTAGSMSHTAFADRDHLIQWLDDRGLSMSGELELAGTYSTVAVDGSYRDTSHLSYDKLYSLDGKRVRVLSNGDYTLGVIAADEDGIMNVHSLNPNLRDRIVFDYPESREMVG